MSATLQNRRAIRAYDEVQRDAIYAVERESIQREPQPPEPCNFCASDIEPDRTVKDYLRVAGAWLMNPDNNPAMFAAVVVFIAICVALSFASVSP
ncbi:hypothetical protein [Rhodanobacter hydrolyticus]|uniref:Uncharacterized protein n=1 Tax=Rhodanobacter hydrolyticus TaxID=2250595 RepID=A0ABW8J584_9GAMM